MSILKIKDPSLPSVLFISILYRALFTEHFLYDFILNDGRNSIIAKEVHTVYGKNLHFGISSQLLKGVLECPTAEIDFAINKQMCSKGTAFRLTPFCFLQYLYLRKQKTVSKAGK